MKNVLLILFTLGVFAYCYGQNLGSQAGGEIIWNDDINFDEIGSAPIISISSDTPFYLFPFGVVEGAGGSAGGHDSGKSSAGDTGSSERTELLKIGSPITLNCKIAHENGNLELKWYKNDKLIDIEESDYKLGENSTLVIPNAKKEDVGVYRCETVSYTPAKSFNVSVVYLHVKLLAKSTMVLEGDKLNLTCEVEGDPMPTIIWLKDKKNVEEVVNNSRFVLEQNIKGTENASFIVESADYSDRAEYMCFIQTGDILYNTTTFVRVKDMYAALWPFLGICAEVFLLCLIIFIYEKRRAKADFEESDTDQPPEQKNTPEQNKDSVRHRK